MRHPQDCRMLSWRLSWCSIAGVCVWVCACTASRKRSNCDQGTEDEYVCSCLGSDKKKNSNNEKKTPKREQLSIVCRISFFNRVIWKKQVYLIINTPALEHADEMCTHAAHVLGWCVQLLFLYCLSCLLRYWLNEPGSHIFRFCKMLSVGAIVQHGWDCLRLLRGAVHSSEPPIFMMFLRDSRLLLTFFREWKHSVNPHQVLQRKRKNRL